MKHIPIILFLAMVSIFICNCKSVERKKELENLILPDFTIREFDLDSSLHIMVPKIWDSIGALISPSYEYKYYVKLVSRKVKEGIRVERLKFKIPTLKLSQLADLYKNEVVTNPGYQEIHLIKESFHMIDSKNTGTVFYSLLDKNETVYLSKVFFINSDSSNTIIDIETRNPDTSISYKWNEYIVNSIKIVK